VTHAPPDVLKLVAHELRWKLLSLLAYSDYRVFELGTLLQKPLNLVSYHLRLLRQAAIVQERRSSADGRDVYYTLDLVRLQALYLDAADSLHPGLAQEQSGANDAPATDATADTTAKSGPPARVLFLCTHNSARSQMAEALLRHLGGACVEVFSAGTEATRVHPMALATLQKHTVDTTGLYSKILDQFLGQDFDYVITVCDNARESCPVFPGDPARIHWSFPDPSAVHANDSQQIAFAEVFAGLEKRLRLLLTVIERDRSRR
jgi:protein-tyrosine-phosphatase/DNA-binding transcriptional ArsR family regulator